MIPSPVAHLSRAGTLAAALLLLACGSGESSIGGKDSCAPGGVKSGNSCLCNAGYVAEGSKCVPDLTGGGGGKPDAGMTCTPFTESCDGIDNDCDGEVDEGFDADGDGYTTCGTMPGGGMSEAFRDCDDGDAAVHPGGMEVADGKDNDCDGRTDYGLPGVDHDGDGFPGLNAQNVPVDCDDDEALVNPNAIEVPGDSVDNNCNGQVDEEINCEAGISGSGTQTPTNASVFMQAMGICGPSVQNVAVTGNSASRAIRTRLGTNFAPIQGQWMLHMSSGYARDKIDQSSWTPQNGQDFGGSSPHPLWSPPPCGPGGQVNTARDLSEITLTLKVPSNARSFSFDFNFFSAEFHEYLCTQYNDRFLVLLSSSALNTNGLVCRMIDGRNFCNVSFDGNGNPLTVNNNFFRICNNVSGYPTSCSQPATLLAGTGYEGGIGGATGWLNTKAPVAPGETAVIKFVVFDEGDGILDSAALIDNFQWELKAVDAPTTSPIN